jgi:hypothetical protein
MEETLSLPVNMPFDKRAVCTKSDTGGEVKEEDWTSSISIENERFAAYL